MVPQQKNVVIRHINTNWQQNVGYRTRGTDSTEVSQTSRLIVEERTTVKVLRRILYPGQYVSLST